MNPGGGIVRGVSRPRAVPAAQAGLADDAEVIGVVADGRPRAYLLTALGDVSRHVVNDVVGDVPVSVTYCDLTNCVKVFTADTPGRPLALDLGGWRGRMLLHVHGALYEQETGVPTEPRPGKPFPYRALPHTRTTWKAWKRAHPDTDVYRGDDIDAPGGG